MRGEFVEVHGCRLYYYAAGTRGVGEPVVFIHGFPASSHLWHGVVGHMPAGHRLVMLDLLGFGRSDRPAEDRALRAVDLSAPMHAARARALMDELGIAAACVVGHGMGGAVAQALALDAPERVSRLCLVDSTGFDVWPRRAARLARLLCRMPAIGRRVGAPLLAGLVHGSLLGGFADRERGRHSLDQYLHAFTARLGADTLVAQLRAVPDPSVSALGKRLRTIQQPTAIVWGAGDPFLPVTLARRLCAAIPGASLDVIADARHFSPEDAPDRVAAAIAALLKR